MTSQRSIVSAASNAAAKISEAVPVLSIAAGMPTGFGKEAAVEAGKKVEAPAYPCPLKKRIVTDLNPKTPEQVMQYAADHPVQTACVAAMAVVAVAPQVATVPLLNAAGFGVGGVVKGELTPVLLCFLGIQPGLSIDFVTI